MNILIVSATKDEVLINGLDHLITGVGMVSTTLELSKRLSVKSYDLVINVGIAGSFNKTLQIGDVVEVVKDTFSEIGAQDGHHFLSPSQMSLDVKTVFHNSPKTKFKAVNSITVNTVHGEPFAIEKVMHRLNPHIESMEGAAFFMTCQRFNVDCIQIRAISNYVEKRNKLNWNIRLAIENLNLELNNFLKEI
jgi:futalosine hydrolase